MNLSALQRPTAVNNNPKQLSRQDRELRDRIRRKLAKSPYYGIRRVTCDVVDGIPVLGGQVGTYFLKQVAQSVVMEALKGETRVKNRIEVAKKNTAKKISRDVKEA